MTIVVGYVPTPEGEAALTAGIREARLRDEPLHVVNTTRGDSLVDPRFASAEALATVRETLEQSGIVFEIDQQVGHVPAEELVEVADRVKASLLVIGMRRRTPTGKLITGSSAQRILLDAHCPVLAVKASY
ncbi:universal stress protein [Blastococcus capsensis]|uniref:universal stress protein n=1 Tax=Blastococcus capsensis TaxID=1564163 RepID=UPI0025419EA4|nr:universal stress protein [Blastococcus capsensis]MDK3256522.1 universal stress protein [Blastococcus capsensis]